MASPGGGAVGCIGALLWGEAAELVVVVFVCQRRLFARLGGKVGEGGDGEGGRGGARRNVGGCSGRERGWGEGVGAERFEAGGNIV